ncbi:MAG: hypothetical protein IPI60_06345 [Saprospiraceae bacterium]|nr:hypothetical protein [Saprospiraceae bacterium]
MFKSFSTKLNPSNWTADQRLSIIYKSVCFCFLIGILITFPLWHHDRLFPMVPFHPALSDFGAGVHYFLLGLLLLITIANIIWKKSSLAIALISIMILLVLLDQMRLQPWVYIYFLMFIPFIWYFRVKDKKDKSSSLQVLNYIRILLIGTYTWSGLHKFSTEFIENVYPSMMMGLFKVPLDSKLLEMKELGYGMAMVELLIGLGLIFPSTRRWSVLLAIIQHLLILAWVSPLGGNTNYAILPWNVAMIILIIFCAYKTKESILFWPAGQNSLKWSTPLLILFIWIMPALNIKDKWDAYLSFNLYTERISHMFVALRQQAIDELDPQHLEYLAFENLIDEGKVIDIERWSFEEMNVPVYPSHKVHCAIGNYFCSKVSNEQNLMLVTYRKPFIDGNYKIFTCKDCL